MSEQVDFANIVYHKCYADLEQSSTGTVIVSSLPTMAIALRRTMSESAANEVLNAIASDCRITVSLSEVESLVTDKGHLVSYFWRELEAVVGHEVI